jgi:hypothetical protein
MRARLLLSMSRRLDLVALELRMGWLSGGDVFINAGHGKGGAARGGARLRALRWGGRVAVIHVGRD